MKETKQETHSDLFEMFEQHRITEIAETITDYLYDYDPETYLDENGSVETGYMKCLEILESGETAPIENALMDCTDANDEIDFDASALLEGLLKFF